MPEPLPPDGFISLRDAFDTFTLVWLGERPSMHGGYSGKVAEFGIRQDAALQYFAGQLRRICAGGKVVDTKGVTHSITAETFSRDAYADLLTLRDTIPVGSGGPLASYAGGIVCVNGAHFFEWLDEESSAHLHSEIQEGRLDPEEADTRRANVKLLPLHPQPEPARFHDLALNKTFWTLPMVVAWIRWRDLDLVVKHMAEFTALCGDWVDFQSGKPGKRWVDADKPSTLDFEVLEYFGLMPVQPMSRDAALKCLKEYLLQGTLVAVARLNGGASYVEIAANDWLGLLFEADKSLVDFAAHKDARYDDLQFKSEAVLNLWSEDNSINVKPRKTVLTAAIPNTRLLAEANTALKNGDLPSTTKAAIEDYFRVRYGSRVRERQCRWVNEQLRPIGGNKPGPKTKGK